MAQHVKLAGLKQRLQSGGQVFVRLGDLRFRLAGRTELLDEIINDAAMCFAFFESPVVSESGNGVGPIVLETHQRHHLIEKASWISVRRQTHDLVLVRVHVEPEVKAENTVE